MIDSAAHSSTCSITLVGDASGQLLMNARDCRRRTAASRWRILSTT